MGRTSTGSDKKMISAGIVLARKKGLSGFTVRELCSKADVNLGMFHYHFKSKNNFDKQLLTTLYQEMMEDLNVKILASSSPRKNIEHILLQVNNFASKNRVIVSAMAADVLNGDKQILQFILQNLTRHIWLLLEELKRAKLTPDAQKQPLISVVVTLALPVIIPYFAVGTIERLGEEALPAAVKEAKNLLCTDTTVQQRIKLLLNAVLGEEK